LEDGEAEFGIGQAGVVMDAIAAKAFLKENLSKTSAQYHISIQMLCKLFTEKALTSKALLILKVRPSVLAHPVQQPS
jgi:hypothetical protein